MCGQEFTTPARFCSEGTMIVPSFLIVDDHPLFQDALQSTLEHGFPGARIDVADTIRSAREKLDGHHFSLVLLDLKMPDASGFEGLTQIRNAHGEIPIVVISAMQGTDVVNRVRNLGAEGFIPKSQPRKDILHSVQCLLNGESRFPTEQAGALKSMAPDSGGIIARLRQLTPQQFKVLVKVCEAKLNKQIAFELGVTETTIKAHITLIFKKMGVHSRTQAVLLMQRMRNELEDSEFSVLLSVQG
jgi:DNA-binding NarL/FixJ family response regulator